MGRLQAAQLAGEVSPLQLPPVLPVLPGWAPPPDMRGESYMPA